MGNSKLNCALVTAVIGREFALNSLLDYFQNVTKPDDFEHLNLYFILGCDGKFTEYLKNQTKTFGLYEKYNKITFIEGSRRCRPELDWKDWEQSMRKEHTQLKHDSALLNVNLGLQSITNEDYIHFVDDDTIPPYHALEHLFTMYNKVENSGVVSGIYFNKEWSGPSNIATSNELKRRVVASINKDKWEESSIEDFTVTDYTDIGFVGNGCMLISNEDVKKITPLIENINNNDTYDSGSPPDIKICYRLRKLGKKVSLVPSVICKHLDDEGNEVGLTTQHIHNTKTSDNPKKTLFCTFDRNVDYTNFIEKYDVVVIIIYTELATFKDIEIITKLITVKNIEIIEKSIVQEIKQGQDFDDFKNDLKSLLTLHQMYDYISDKVEYKIDLYKETTNEIINIPLLDSSKLRDFLNTPI